MHQISRFIINFNGLFIFKNIDGSIWITNYLCIFYYIKDKMYMNLGVYLTQSLKMEWVMKKFNNINVKDHNDEFFKNESLNSLQTFVISIKK